MTKINWPTDKIKENWERVFPEGDALAPSADETKYFMDFISGKIDLEHFTEKIREPVEKTARLLAREKYDKDLHKAIHEPFRRQVIKARDAALSLSIYIEEIAEQTTQLEKFEVAKKDPRCAMYLDIFVILSEPLIYKVVNKLSSDANPDIYERASFDVVAESFKNSLLVDDEQKFALSTLFHKTVKFEILSILKNQTDANNYRAFRGITRSYDAALRTSDPESDPLLALLEDPRAENLTAEIDAEEQSALIAKLKAALKPTLKRQPKLANVFDFLFANSRFPTSEELCTLSGDLRTETARQYIEKAKRAINQDLAVFEPEYDRLFGYDDNPDRQR